MDTGLNNARFKGTPSFLGKLPAFLTVISSLSILLSFLALTKFKVDDRGSFAFAPPLVNRKDEKDTFGFDDVLSTNDVDPNDYSLHTNNPVCNDSLLNTNNKSETIRININPESTIASDISKIWHNPSTKSICIHLRSGSRCPAPDPLGRLSGTSIAMLKWAQKQSNHEQEVGDGTVFCGSYTNAWLTGGIYFLEILIIHCNGLGVIQKDISQMMQIDFANVCIEDPKYSRLTGCAFVNIEPTNPSKEDVFIGHWSLKNDVDTNPRQWFTRYQPLGCREPEQIQQPNCSIPMHNGRAAEYSFRWKSNAIAKRMVGLYLSRHHFSAITHELFFIFSICLKGIWGFPLVFLPFFKMSHIPRV
jgi:hypothetical protein